MKPASSPEALRGIEQAHATARTLIAQAAKCRPEDVVAKDVQVLKYTRRFEDPTGAHFAVVELVLGGVVLEVHGPHCGHQHGILETPVAPPVPATPVPPQADGGA